MVIPSGSWEWQDMSDSDDDGLGSLSVLLVADAGAANMMRASAASFLFWTSILCFFTSCLCSKRSTDALSFRFLGDGTKENIEGMKSGESGSSLFPEEMKKKYELIYNKLLIDDNRC